MNDQIVVVLNATIRPDQKAKLIQYGKDEGKISVSEALRDLLDFAFEKKAEVDGFVMRSTVEDGQLVEVAG
jgi:hypothetical protein